MCIKHVCSLITVCCTSPLVFVSAGIVQVHWCLFLQVLYKSTGVCFCRYCTSPLVFVYAGIVQVHWCLFLQVLYKSTGVCLCRYCTSPPVFVSAGIVQVHRCLFLQVTIELIKVVLKAPLEHYKNCFLNLAIPDMIFSEPGPAVKTTLR